MTQVLFHPPHQQHASQVRTSATLWNTYATLLAWSVLVGTAGFAQQALSRDPVSVSCRRCHRDCGGSREGSRPPKVGPASSHDLGTDWTHAVAGIARCVCVFGPAHRSAPLTGSPSSVTATRSLTLHTHLPQADWARRIIVEEGGFVVVNKPAGVQVVPRVDNVRESLLACVEKVRGCQPKMFPRCTSDLPLRTAPSVTCVQRLLTSPDGRFPWPPPLFTLLESASFSLKLRI